MDKHRVTPPPLPGKMCFAGKVFFEKLWMSEQSTFSERDALAARDHEVIQHAHINQCQCITQPAGEHFIRTAGFSDTRRVVVKEDYGGGVHLQGLLHHNPWVNRRTVDGALEQFAQRDDPVPVVEE